MLKSPRAQGKTSAELNRHEREVPLTGSRDCAYRHSNVQDRTQWTRLRVQPCAVSARASPPKDRGICHHPRSRRPPPTSVPPGVQRSLSEWLGTGSWISRLQCELD